MEEVGHWREDLVGLSLFCTVLYPFLIHQDVHRQLYVPTVIDGSCPTFKPSSLMVSSLSVYALK